MSRSQAALGAEPRLDDAARPVRVAEDHGLAFVGRARARTAASPLSSASTKSDPSGYSIRPVLMLNVDRLAHHVGC